MKRALFALASLVVLPIGAAVGCNAILGNAPGLLANDASLAGESGGGANCGPGTKDCQGVCVDISQPNNGCAGACNACATPKNAQAACDLKDNAFVCGVGQCNTGFADCNSSPTDGCESPLTSKTSCGSCDENCVDAGFAFCSPGTGCSNTCNGTDCCGAAACASQTDPSGECVDTSNNRSNCGSCGNDCTAIPGAAQVDCVSGHCVVQSCVANMALCNGTCVAETNTACGTSCTNCTNLGQVCVGGTCQGCSGSTFCGTSCCGQNCCGSGITAVCQAGACGCSGSQFQCGSSTNCCNSGTDVCCNINQCTPEGNSACGPNCSNCQASTSHCDTGAAPHACACNNAGDSLCSTTSIPTQYWCCAKGLSCGPIQGQCNTALCNGPQQCDLGGGNCGCGSTADCFPATASPNCGSCGISCTGIPGACCCASGGGGGDAGISYTCQTGHAQDGGATNCAGCNP